MKILGLRDLPGSSRSTGLTTTHYLRLSTTNSVISSKSRQHLQTTRSQKHDKQYVWVPCCSDSHCDGLRVFRAGRWFRRCLDSERSLCRCGSRRRTLRYSSELGHDCGYNCLDLSHFLGRSITTYKRNEDMINGGMV